MFKVDAESAPWLCIQQVECSFCSPFIRRTILLEAAAVGASRLHALVRHGPANR
jgi:hypothetical protein